MSPVKSHARRLSQVTGNRNRQLVSRSINLDNWQPSTALIHQNKDWERVQRMLKFVPTKGGNNQLKLWRRSNSLTPELFLQYWKAVGMMGPMFDTTASSYQEWMD